MGPYGLLWQVTTLLMWQDQSTPYTVTCIYNGRFSYWESTKTQAGTSVCSFLSQAHTTYLTRSDVQGHAIQHNDKPVTVAMAYWCISKPLSPTDRFGPYQLKNTVYKYDWECHERIEMTIVMGRELAPSSNEVSWRKAQPSPRSTAAHDDSYSARNVYNLKTRLHLTEPHTPVERDEGTPTHFPRWRTHARHHTNSFPIVATQFLARATSLPIDPQQ